MMIKKILIVFIVFYSFASLALVVTSSEGEGSEKKITLQNPYAYEQFYTGTYIGMLGGFSTVEYDGTGKNVFTYKASDGSNRIYSAGTQVTGNVSSILPTPKGYSAGIYAGYGYQTAMNLYFSGEALFYFLEPSAQVKSETSIYKDSKLQNSLSIASENKEGQEISINGRIGYVIRRRFLLYTKFGYRLATFSLDTTFLGKHRNLDGELKEYGPVELQPSIQLSGITLGGGFEYPIPIRFGTVKFTIRNELMYTKYFTYTLASPSDKNNIQSSSNISVDASAVLFTVGLNVLF